MNHQPRKRHHNNHGKNNHRGRTHTPQSSVLSLSKVYDSNGPAGKVRGTAQVVYERYQSLARDAQASDDRVLAENFLQHAEHYLRLIHMIQEQMQANGYVLRSESIPTEEGSEEGAYHLSEQKSVSVEENNPESDPRETGRRTRSLYGQRRSEYARPNQSPRPTEPFVTDARLEESKEIAPVYPRRNTSRFPQRTERTDSVRVDSVSENMTEIPTEVKPEETARRRGVVRRRVPARTEAPTENNE